VDLFPRVLTNDVPVRGGSGLVPSEVDHIIPA
jgi:hypothetical protein